MTDDDFRDYTVDDTICSVMRSFEKTPVDDDCETMFEVLENVSD